VIAWGLPEVPQRVVPPRRVEGEIERLRIAVARVRAHLVELAQRTKERAGPEEAKIFDAQILMLQDTDFLAGVELLVRQNHISAERAFEYKTLEVRALWAQSGNAMLQQRRADLYDIGIQVIKSLLGQSVQDALPGKGGRPVIVITRELTPALTVEFDRGKVAGFASVEGTRTSHAAILAHSLGIPCVMGLVGKLEGVSPNAEVLLDGNRGTLLLDPTAAELAEATDFANRLQSFGTQVERGRPGPAATLDGQRISLRGNLDLPEELDMALTHGAEGVGLLRTEFLLLGRTELPSEDEQAAYYSRIAERFAGHPVVVRSYDLGGDKFPAPFRPQREPNPFLGWRAIRVCLDQPEMFCTQIRAVMRARAAGDVQLMLPLVTQVEEVTQTREYVEEVAEELRKAGIPHDPKLPVGVMIETPAAAIMIDELATHSDFLSVGTNDLTQYTLAVDRSNAGLADRYTPFHPAVVRSLRRLIQVGNGTQRSVSVCGEMASEPMAALLLLALGYTVFSVAPPKLSLVRWLARQVDLRQLSQMGDAVLQASTTQEVTNLITEAVAGVIDPGLLK
jgi:phosphotransferase system enzyme I (PtsI)